MATAALSTREQVFITKGVYRGTDVAVKEARVRRVVLDKHLREEMVQVRL